MTSDRPLAGRRVITTREQTGRLDRLLTADGADVVHVPLIEIVDPPDPTALARAVDALDEGAWVVVTSRPGALRVGPLVAGRTGLRLAAVGRATADALELAAGRRPEIVPDRQTAADLAAAMPSDEAPGVQVLVAQADLAEPTLAVELGHRGFECEAVVAYSNRRRSPSESERAAVGAADAVTFASGSAAESWVAAFGTSAPPLVVAIGPSTARVASSCGLAVTHVAADHDIEGLAAEVATALAERP